MEDLDIVGVTEEDDGIRINIACEESRPWSLLRYYTSALDEAKELLQSRHPK